MTQPLVVCADDYAYSSSICDAIVELAERGRISAISCMTAAPLWRAQAHRLVALRDRVDIGLHLTLIEETPLTAMPKTITDGKLPSLVRVMADSYTGRLALDEFAAEIRAQCDAFTDAIGAPPAHIDGHRHTHVLPGLRKLVIDAATGFAPRPWVRNIVEPINRVIDRGVAMPKTLLLSALGAGLATAAATRGVPVNDGFSGVYSLAPDEDFPTLFARFVASAGPRPVIMCHPGKADDAPLAATRAKEYAFLGSDAFPAMLAGHGFHVARLAA